jgi:NAD(P)H-flavin reductase
MIYLAEALRGHHAVAVVGATRGDLLPLTVVGKREAAKRLPAPTAMEGMEQAWDVAEFAAFGIPTIITTDDGSLGIRGRVTEALEKVLDGVGGAVWLYTCGPEAMMKRVAQIAAARGLAVQVAVERAMACGMGTCQSCCIRVRKKEPAKPPLAGSSWAYRLACTDGPVFLGADLLW